MFNIIAIATSDIGAVCLVAKAKEYVKIRKCKNLTSMAEGIESYISELKEEQNRLDLLNKTSRTRKED